MLLYVLVGFSEELFFRGYVMRTLESTGYRKPIIYFVSAILFSIVHGANPNVSLIGLLNVGLVGLLFAYMFDITENLWMPIGYHITWNYFQGAVFGFPVSALKLEGLYQTEIIKGKEWLSGGEFGPEAGILATLLILANYVFIKFMIKKQRSVSNTS
ncbi:CPBP family intramembrane glutamic endopeptidase [Ammoniphilus sp. 3BR4]|uniref:CPBP family intramembrane glutamic endopeptidase n=1 Tax=Ammoniphilus sp. 3BR4 TaxID=3158265 RepID=UPI003467DD85